MRRARTLAACLGVSLLLTLTASSVRADSFRAGDSVVKLKSNEGHDLNRDDSRVAGLMAMFPEVFEGNNGLHLGLANGRHLGLNGRVGEDDVFPEVFDNNNGKHLGFSTASTNLGNKFGLFKGPQSPQTSAGGGAIPNPEPAAVFLLGTGLAAVGAFARWRFRKSSH